MKVGQDFFPKSSFLSVEKNLQVIVNKLLENQRLCKLLYYTQRDCLEAPDLTMEQRLSMIGKQIQIIPHIEVKEDCPNRLIIQLSDFTPNAKNPEFRDCIVRFCALCDSDHWSLGDFKLRPYKIIGEIDAMLNRKKLTGIGELNFLGCDNLVLNESLQGLLLLYTAIQGIEDKK